MEPRRWHAGSDRLARMAKRSFDVAVAGASLVVLSPLLAGVALVVLKDSGRPMLFRQIRPGLHGAPFRMYKFRTMSNERDDSGALASDRERLTPVGSALRRWSLDELPELWNILRGDMSLVGPRPLLMEYIPLYSSEQMRRHDMRPGLTGLAQVSGRNDQSWEERLAMDVWYVDHWSLGLDLRILLKTVGKVLRGSGVSADGEATMPKFTGVRDA